MIKFRAASLQIQALGFSSIILQHLPLFLFSNRSQCSPDLMAGWNRRRKWPCAARPCACRTCHCLNSWFMGKLLTFSQRYALDLAARANSTFGREVSQSLFEWYQQYCFFALFWAGPVFPSETEEVVTYPVITVALWDVILHMGLVTLLTQPQANTAIRLWGNRKFQLLCFFSPTSEYQNHSSCTAMPNTVV